MPSAFLIWGNPIAESRIASQTLAAATESGGRHSPVFSCQSAPAGSVSKVSENAVESEVSRFNTSTVGAMISGPIPSPSKTAILNSCFDNDYSATGAFKENSLSELSGNLRLVDQFDVIGQLTVRYVI